MLGHHTLKSSIRRAALFLLIAVMHVGVLFITHLQRPERIVEPSVRSRVTAWLIAEVPESNKPEDRGPLSHQAPAARPPEPQKQSRRSRLKQSRPEVEGSKSEGQPTLEESTPLAIDPGGTATPTGSGSTPSGSSLDLKLPQNWGRHRQSEKAATKPLDESAHLTNPVSSAIEKSANEDCRVAYANMGVLAVPALLRDALRARGCKW